MIPTSPCTHKRRVFGDLHMKSGDSVEGGGSAKSSKSGHWGPPSRAREGIVLGSRASDVTLAIRSHDDSATGLAWNPVATAQSARWFTSPSGDADGDHDETPLSHAPLLGHDVDELVDSALAEAKVAAATRRVVGKELRDKWCELVAKTWLLPKGWDPRMNSELEGPAGFAFGLSLLRAGEGHMDTGSEGGPAGSKQETLLRKALFRVLGAIPKELAATLFHLDHLESIVRGAMLTSKSVDELVQRHAFTTKVEETSINRETLSGGAFNGELKGSSKPRPRRVMHMTISSVYPDNDFSIEKHLEHTFPKGSRSVVTRQDTKTVTWTLGIPDKRAP